MSGAFLGNVRAISIVQVTSDPASVAANTTAEQTITVPGVLAGDFIDVRKPTLTAGLGIVNARASATNTVSVTFGNFTASPIDAASETYTIRVTRPEVIGATSVVA